MKNFCAACRHFDEYATDNDGVNDITWGACTKYPPVWINAHPNHSTVDEMLQNWRQPMVAADDTCGEFTASDPS